MANIPPKTKKIESISSRDHLHACSFDTKTTSQLAAPSFADSQNEADLDALADHGDLHQLVHQRQDPSVRREATNSQVFFNYGKLLILFNN